MIYFHINNLSIFVKNITSFYAEWKMIKPVFLRGYTSIRDLQWTIMLYNLNKWTMVRAQVKWLWEETHTERL